MKRITLTVLLSFTTTVLLASAGITLAVKRDSEDAGKMKTLFQCGEDTERGFEGWMLSGLSNETFTWFGRDHIEFFQHNPGNYSIGFSKKIEDMVGYTDLRISADIGSVENCNINCATAYVSRDGKEWVALNDDPRYGANIYAEKMEFMFVKIVADITFFNQGRFRINRTAVYGDYKVRSGKPEFELTEMTAIANGPVANLIYDEFFIFSFGNNINVETKNERDYDFILSNTLGQVVLRERSNGSRRFELDVPGGIYFVSIVQEDQLITTKKVVL